MKEHEPVVAWMRERMNRSRFCDEIDTARVDTAMEITSGICGENGCNFTCRAPCEAIKFILLTYLHKSVIPMVTLRSGLFEQYIALYG